MGAWIQTVLKAASARGAAKSASHWNEVETLCAMEVPDEVKAFYEAADGASLLGGVRLYSWGEVENHLDEIPQGLPSAGIWLLGEKDGSHPIFTARKSELVQVSTAAAHTDWVAELPGHAWVYGLQRAPNDLKFYRSFEQLMSRLVPPVETEEFGEVTYVRALSAIQSALDDVEVTSLTKMDTRPGKKTAPKKKKPAKSKPKAKAKAKAKAKPKLKVKVKAKAKAKAKLVKKPLKKSKSPKRRR